MSVNVMVDAPVARNSPRSAELVAVMWEQERICLRLLELSTEERAAMAEGRIDLVESLTRRKNSLIEEMEQLEQLRRRIAAQLALESGLPEEVSLRALAARLSGQEAEDLLEARRRVGEAVARLRESNEDNLLLMRQALGVVRDSIRQLRQVAVPGDSYTVSGQPRFGVGGNLLVDCRA